MDEDETQRLYDVGRMVGWGPEKVKQECETVRFRLKLEMALRQGKGRLTSNEYQNFLAEGINIGWNTGRIGEVIERHKHLRTWVSGIRVKVTDFFSTSQPPSKDTANEAREANSEIVETRHDHAEATRKACEEKERRVAAEQKRRRAQRVAEKAARRAREEEDRRIAAEQIRKQAEREAGEAAHKASEEEKRRAAAERRRIEKERQKAKQKKPPFVRLAALIGAVLGFVATWYWAGQQVSSKEELFVAVLVGTAFGAIALPIIIFLLRVAVRIIVVVLLLAIVILAYLFMQYGYDGALNQIERFFQQLLSQF